MWPWGHLGVAYCLLSPALERTDGHPDAGAAALVAVGSQLPDLVDKPLAWSLGTLPTGRALGHSLLVAGPAVLLVAAALARRGRPAWGAGLAVGHLSHALVDALPAVRGGEWAMARFLLWPAARPVEPEIAQSFAAHAAGLSATPYQGLQVGLLVAAAALWIRDGRPGLAEALALGRRLAGRARSAVGRIANAVGR